MCRSLTSISGGSRQIGWNFLWLQANQGWNWRQIWPGGPNECRLIGQSVVCIYSLSSDNSADIHQPRLTCAVHLLGYWTDQFEMSCPCCCLSPNRGHCEYQHSAPSPCTGHSKHPSAHHDNNYRTALWTVVKTRQGRIEREISELLLMCDCFCSGGTLEVIFIQLAKCGIHSLGLNGWWWGNSSVCQSVYWFNDQHKVETCIP